MPSGMNLFRRVPIPPLNSRKAEEDGLPVAPRPCCVPTGAALPIYVRESPDSMASLTHLPLVIAERCNTQIPDLILRRNRIHRNVPLLCSAE